MRLTGLALLLATASCARQKYKGAPPEALHTAILHGGGVEGVDHELKRGAKLKGRDAQSRTAGWGVLFLVGHCRSSHDLRF